MTTASTTAAAYGIHPAPPKHRRTTARITQATLEVFLADPKRKQKLAAFEASHRLPELASSQKTPHPREARYLFMSSGQQILPEAARNLTDPTIWYLLAGLPECH